MPNRSCIHGGMRRPPECCRADRRDRAPRSYRTLNSDPRLRHDLHQSRLHLFGDRPALRQHSRRCITARIQCSGTANRFDASADKSCEGIDGQTVRSMRCRRRSRGMRRNARATSVDAKIATMHAIVPRDRKAAIVLAAVQGKALSRRPRGRPGPPLRATAIANVVGTEEWCCVRSNRGMTEFSRRTITITPPWSTQAAPCR